MSGSSRLQGAWLGACLLAGCGGPAEPPPAPIEPRAPAAPIELEPATPGTSTTQPELCEVVAGLLTGEHDGFAALRGQQVAAERWTAEASVPGLGSCVIEGSAWPHARFTCASGRLRPEQARARFDGLVAEVDRCLARPSWFPRHWEKGQLFQFAMGERQQGWVDQTTAPPTAVVLKVQQDLVHWDYRLLLSLQTIR